MLTSEREGRREDDMNSRTVDIKHDPKVYRYTTEDRKAVYKRPVRCVQ